MRLKELRQKNRLTQVELAKALSIGVVTYNRYELGLREPDIDTMKKIADYFNVTLDYLLEHDVKNSIDTSNLTETQKGCVFLIQKLNENNTTMLLGYATRLLQEQNKLLD